MLTFLTSQVLVQCSTKSGWSTMMSYIMFLVNFNYDNHIVKMSWYHFPPQAKLDSVIGFAWISLSQRDFLTFSLLLSKQAAQFEFSRFSKMSLCHYSCTLTLSTHVYYENFLGFNVKNVLMKYIFLHGSLYSYKLK